MDGVGGKTSTYGPGKPPPGKKEGLKIILFQDVEAVVDASDFVEDLLTEGGMSVIYGEPNSGKTFLILDLAFHVARGEPWMGREVDQGGVLYVALEGGIGIRNRVAAYRQANGLTDSSIPFALITQPVSLLQEAGVDALIDAIKALGERFGAKLRLVVIDTASRALAGGDENSSVDMGCLIANADCIRAETGVHVTFIHHSGKDAARGARGWSGLRGAIDTELEVIEDQGSRRVEVRKQRDLDRGPAFGFALEAIDLGINRRGKPVRSCIVTCTAGVAKSTETPLSGHVKRSYEVLLDLLVRDGLRGAAGTPPGMSSLPEQAWRDGFYSNAMPGDAQDTKQKAFRRASQDLINRKLVGMAAGRVWITREQQADSHNN